MLILAHFWERANGTSSAATYHSLLWQFQHSNANRPHFYANVSLKPQSKIGLKLLMNIKSSVSACSGQSDDTLWLYWFVDQQARRSISASHVFWIAANLPALGQPPSGTGKPFCSCTTHELSNCLIIKSIKDLMCRILHWLNRIQKETRLSGDVSLQWFHLVKWTLISF